MTWILVICVMIGDYLNIKKKWHGFIFWIITDGTFAVINFRQGENAEACVFAMYTIFAIYGIYAWKIKKKTNELSI